MKQRGGVYNQLAPRRKNSPKLNKALLIINSVLFVCSLVVGVLLYTAWRASFQYFNVSYLCSDDFQCLGCLACVAKTSFVRLYMNKNK